MALFDRGKDKKAAADAKKLADQKSKEALMADYKAKHAETKASIAAARAEKAEKELKDMKAAKARQAIAKQKAMMGRTGSAARIGSGIPGGGMSPFGAQAPKLIASYTVKKGDTLSQIAKNFYGATGPKYWNLIQAANKDIIKDVNKIDVGQVFKIPALPEDLKK